jgi:hypothetical protein
MNPATIESLRQTIVHLTATVEKTQVETRRWQVIALLLPVVATAVLGYIGEQWKSTLQTSIDTHSKELGMRLSLTEEFYKRKLTVHQEQYQKLVTAMTALTDARFNPDSKAQAVNSLAQLTERTRSAGLYLSPMLVTLLKQFGDTATLLPSLYPQGTARIADLNALFERIQQQMINDLQLTQFNMAPNKG